MSPWNVAVVALLALPAGPQSPTTQAPTTPSTYNPATQSAGIVEKSRQFSATDGAAGCNSTMDFDPVGMSNRPNDPRTSLKLRFTSGCNKRGMVRITPSTPPVLDCHATSGKPKLGEPFLLTKNDNSVLTCTLKPNVGNDTYRHKVSFCTVTSGTTCDPTAGPEPRSFELEIHVPDK